MLKIINQGDVCPILGVIMILCILGKLISDQRQRMWGVVVGVVSFLVYGAYALDEFNPRSGDDLFGISLRSLLTFGLVTGLSWLILPLLYGAIRMAWLKVQAGHGTVQQESDARKRAEADRRKAKEAADAEAKAAPEKERLKKEAELAATEAEKNQQGRDDARVSVEMFYQLHKHILSQRLSREEFDDFVKRYIDGCNTEQMQERKKKLMDLMEGHLKQLAPLTADLAMRCERENARTQASKFYEGNADLLQEIYPREMLEAYLRKEMHEERSPDECWQACHTLIAELLPKIAAERQERKKRGEGKAKRETQIAKIEADIESRNKIIERLSKSGADRDMVEGKILDHRKDIQELERKLATLKGDTHAT